MRGEVDDGEEGLASWGMGKVFPLYNGAKLAILFGSGGRAGGWPGVARDGKADKETRRQGDKVRGRQGEGGRRPRNRAILGKAA